MKSLDGLMPISSLEHPKEQESPVKASPQDSPANLTSTIAFEFEANNSHSSKPALAQKDTKTGTTVPGPGLLYSPSEGLQEHSPPPSSPCSAKSSSSGSPPRSISSSPAQPVSESHDSPPRQSTRIITEANFILEEFSASDYEAWESGDEDVIRPHQYDDADIDSDRAQSVNPIRPNDLDSLLSRLSLHCENEEEDREAWVKAKRARRKWKRSSGCVLKRTLSQSIGSDTDEEDLQPVAFEGANEAGSTARKLRRNTKEGGSLVFDEVDEEEDGGDGQCTDRELPYYRYVKDVDANPDICEEVVYESRVENKSQQTVDRPRPCYGIEQRSSSSSESKIPARTLSGELTGHQDGYRGEDENPDEDPEDRLQGSGGKNPGFGPNTDQIPPQFACPYRKHNPRKYGVADWRSCALSHHKTIARVKGHLYRYHIIHQCQRCKTIFQSDKELDSHIETSDRCDAILAPPVDGITRKMKALLQCKKKAFPGQTEAERWKQVYQILFPDVEDVPDPYFEPVRDIEESTTVSPPLTDITNYEDYLRRVLPRLVRNALETQVDNGIQPIEERLRGQILDVIEQSQNRAFLEYRAMINTDPSGKPSANSRYFPSHSRSGSSQSSGGKKLPSDLTVGSSISSTAEPDGTLKSSETFSAQFIATDFAANLEPTASVQQGFGNTSPSEVYASIQGTAWSEFSSLEADCMKDPSLFLDQPWGPIPDMDLDSFNWDLLVEGNISTN